MNLLKLTSNSLGRYSRKKQSLAQLQEVHSLDSKLNLTLSANFEECVTPSAASSPRTVRFGIGHGIKTSGGYRSLYKPIYEELTCQSPTSHDMYLEAEEKLDNEKQHQQPRKDKV